jgi:two-component system sensor histidine kinase UhpB
MNAYALSGASAENVDRRSVALAARNVAPHASRIVFRAVGGPLLLGLAYYVGAQVGFALQSPTAPQSVLWLPNSIVLAVLLVVPVRRWPLYLLAGVPAQLLVAVQTGAPVTTMALLFVTNCADASLGAAIVRRLSPGPLNFSDLRTTLVFVAFAATLSPVVLSFADAAITVLTGWGGDYWAAFVTRMRSNVLTHLVVVPATVTALSTSTDAWRAIPAHRYTEGLAALIGILAATMVIFDPTAVTGGLPVRGLPAPFILAFLLWLAVRFGPGMTGLGLLVITLVASWIMIYPSVPVTRFSLEQAIARLQFFVTGIAIPLLCLAAVIQERAAASAALRRSYDQIRELTTRVSMAHEIARARFAAELHDEMNRRFRELAVALSGLKRRYAERADLREDLAEMQRRTAGLEEWLRAMSRQLHPGVLRRTALASAVRALCADVASQSGIEVTSHAEDISPVTDEIGLCVYRVVQEALRNAVTHADVRRVDVTLRSDDRQIEVSVLDDGRGFTVDQARRHGGLALIDLEDRVRLIDGELRVDAQPHRGTSVRVRVPLGEGHAGT